MGGVDGGRVEIVGPFFRVDGEIGSKDFNRTNGTGQDGTRRDHSD